MSDLDAAPIDAPPPWERIPGETPKAYSAFLAFREMGSQRSLRKLAMSGDERTSHLRQMATWSSQHAWVERAAAYDEHIAREGMAAEIEAVRQMRQRHAQAALALQAKALQRLQTLNPDHLAAKDVVVFIKEAVAIERAARGVEGPPIEERERREEGITVEELVRLQEALAARAEQSGRE